MAEQAVWRVKRVTLSIPVPSVAAMRTRAWLIGPPLLLGLLAALIASQLTTRTWRSEAKVLIVAPDTSPLLARRLVAAPRGGLAAAVSLARSSQLAGRVVRAAAVPGLTARQFLRDSSVKLRPDSSVLALSVSYHRRALAMRLTGAYGAQFVRFFRERMKPPRQARHQLRLVQSSPSKPSAIVFQPARVVASFRPHALRNDLLAAVFGALLGVALAVAVGLRRGRRG
jgi:hypothetical protein